MTEPFRTHLSEQDLLLPPSLRDWLPEDHLAYFVSDVVDQLDLSAIESVYGALEELFRQVLRLTLETGTMKLGRVVLDGSKVKANASKHKAMSYGRMKETEKRLREKVRSLLRQA
jgi:transposase